jgi:excisionase family DNA binding protein
MQQAVNVDAVVRQVGPRPLAPGNLAGVENGMIGKAVNEAVANTAAYFEPLLNDADAAWLLGDMHVKTLQRMARYGQIPSHKIGRFWYFRASELNTWLKSSCAVSKVC